MRYTMRLRTLTAPENTTFFGADYFRDAQRPSGLFVESYLGSIATVVASGIPEDIDGLHGWQLETLSRMSTRPEDTQDDSVLVDESGLEDFVSRGISIWDTLLSRDRPRRVLTHLAEARTPDEVTTQSGLFLPQWADVPQDTIINRGNEFLGYIANPDEISAIERMGRFVQDKIVDPNAGGYGNYL